MKQKTKGFTLIELLVVIAIIGVLSAVVLASLNAARLKGNDAGVKANLNTVRTEAGLTFDSNGNTYAAAAITNDTCPAAVVASSMWDATTVNAIKQTKAVGSTVKCNVTAGKFGAFAVWGSVNTGGFYCVDSLGAAGLYATAPATGSTKCS